MSERPRPIEPPPPAEPPPPDVGAGSEAPPTEAPTPSTDGPGSLGWWLEDGPESPIAADIEEPEKHL